MFLVVAVDDELFIEPDGDELTIESNGLTDYRIIDVFRYYYQAEECLNSILKRRHLSGLE